MSCWMILVAQEQALSPRAIAGIDQTRPDPRCRLCREAPEAGWEASRYSIQHQGWTGNWADRESTSKGAGEQPWERGEIPASEGAAGGPECSDDHGALVHRQLQLQLQQPQEQHLQPGEMRLLMDFNVLFYRQYGIWPIIMSVICESHLLFSWRTQSFGLTSCCAWHVRCCSSSTLYSKVWSAIRSLVTLSNRNVQKRGGRRWYSYKSQQASLNRSHGANTALCQQLINFSGHDTSLICQKSIQAGQFQVRQVTIH